MAIIARTATSTPETTGDGPIAAEAGIGDKAHLTAPEAL